MTEAVSAHPRVQAPEALDLVDAAQFSGDVAEIERELAELTERAAAAVAAADDAETTARSVDIDVAATTWTIVRLQRFLDDLRAEAERDAATMVEVSRYHARVRAADAREMVTRGDRHRRPAVIDSGVAADPVVADVPRLPFATPAAPATPVVPLVVPASAVIGPTPVADPVAAMPTAPVAAVVTPPLPQAQPMPVAPQPSAFAPAPQIQPQPMPVAQQPPAFVQPQPQPPIAPAAAVAAVAVPRAAVAPPPPVLAPQPPVVAPVVQEPEAPPAGNQKPSKKSKKSGARKRRGLPLSAILEILAVLLLLAFIVFKLS